MKKLLLIFLICPLISFSQTQIGQDIDGEAAGDRSGLNISVSSDGKIVAITAHNNDGNGIDSGHVRIYENIEETWTQIGQDIEGEAEGDYFGTSVSLSSDGLTVAIGAAYHNSNGIRSGHVKIYRNIEGTWTQLGSNINGEAPYDFFGSSVSLSSNSAIVAIGAIGYDDNGSFSGQVRVYENIGGTWTQIGQDINGEAENDASGVAISLSSDGTILSIGAHFNDENGTDSGHVRIYENIEGIWTQIGQDINGQARIDYFGGSVSLSSDGSIVAIGSNNNDENSENAGQVRIYKNVADNWIQIGQAINGEGVNDAFGGSVSLSSNGTIIAIGAQLNNDDGVNISYTKIFKNVGDNWLQIGNNINEENINDSSGSSVSLSSNGSIVAIGAVGNSDNGNISGHVRVYDLSLLLSSNEFVLSQFNLYPNPAKNQVNIQLQEGLNVNEVNIYSTLGQFISTSKENIINTSHLSPGMYLIEIKTNLGKATKQLIIE